MSKQFFGNRWHIVSPLGEGGQAHTFIVRDLREGSKTWVLKKLKNTKRLGRFEREIEALKKIKSQYIPVIEDYSVEDPAYIVCPYLGITLERFVKNSPLSIGNALDLFEQVVEATRDAHGQGIKHRDIKPNNIVISPDGLQAYLIDFGICQYEDHEMILTTTDEPLGNPAFAPPECFLGRQEEPGFPCDIYSLGKVLYWMVTGGEYINRENLSPEVLSKIATDDQHVKFCIARLLRGTIRENAADRWDISKLLSEIKVTKELIERTENYARGNYILIYDGFGLNDTYNLSFRSATTPGYGNPPADGDIGTAFIVPGQKDAQLDSLALALHHAAGPNVIDLWLMDDAGGEPDDANILETFRFQGKGSNERGVVNLQSISRPILKAGNQYWLVISVPEPNSRVDLYSGPSDFMPHSAKYVERFDQGDWQVGNSESGPGYAIRILARPT